MRLQAQEEEFDEAEMREAMREMEEEEEDLRRESKDQNRPLQRASQPRDSSDDEPDSRAMDIGALKAQREKESAKLEVPSDEENYEDDFN